MGPFERCYIDDHSRMSSFFKTPTARLSAKTLIETVAQETATLLPKFVITPSSMSSTDIQASKQTVMLMQLESTPAKRKKKYHTSKPFKT